MRKGRVSQEVIDKTRGLSKIGSYKKLFTAASQDNERRDVMPWRTRQQKSDEVTREGDGASELSVGSSMTKRLTTTRWLSTKSTTKAGLMKEAGNRGASAKNQPATHDPMHKTS